MNAIHLSTETAIRKLVHDRAAAFRNKNVSGVLETQTEDIVQFILSPPLKFAGETAFGREALKEWFDGFEGPLGYEVTELEVSASDDLAFCHSLNHLTGTSPKGERGDLWFRDTLCLRKIAGTWKITHEHSSVPFYMDSMKAAIDLKPSDPGKG
jgi:ketosteroid isomerase-like protein